MIYKRAILRKSYFQYVTGIVRSGAVPYQHVKKRFANQCDVHGDRDLESYFSQKQESDPIIKKH